MLLNFDGIDVHVSRAGEYGSPDRFRYDVKVPCLGVSSWITVRGDDFNKIIGAALWEIDSVGFEDYEDYAGEIETIWSLYADDILTGRVGAASFLVSSIRHYRTVPYTFDPDSETYRTLKDAVRDFQSAAWYQHEDDEYSWDLYANDSDEPTYRLTLGPRGGVSVDNH